MKQGLFVTILLISMLLLAACGAAESEAGEIVVENVRANMTLPSSTGSFWMVITNHSSQDDALVGVKFDGCGVIELHDMFMDNDVMVMRPVEGGRIPIPAGETVELQPGGLHVMCMQKEAPLAVDTAVTLELQFANAGTISVEGIVVEPAMGSEMDHGG
jgi:periplasmic copper chaperone A